VRWPLFYEDDVYSVC